MEIDISRFRLFPGQCFLSSCCCVIPKAFVSVKTSVLLILPCRRATYRKAVSLQQFFFLVLRG